MAGFENRYNSELANDLGNLLSRTAAMINKYSSGVVPAPDPSASGNRFATDAAQMKAAVIAAVDRVELTAALEHIWRFVRSLNKYVEDSAPWKLAKDEERRPELDAVLYDLAEGLRVAAILLHPIMPDATIDILKRLGQPGDGEALHIDRAEWGRGVPGAQVSQGSPLFPKLPE
jgi:methionyl-tRNA synthetase